MSRFVRDAYSSYSCQNFSRLIRSSAPTRKMKRNPSAARYDEPAIQLGLIHDGNIHGRGLGIILPLNAR